MSYILDALKKADHERTLGDVPDLETAHWGERRRQRTVRWAWVVVALLVFNGVLLAVLLDRDDHNEPRSLPVSPVPKTDSVAVQPSRKITRPREPVYMPPVVQRPAPAVRLAQPPVYKTEAVDAMPAAVAAPKRSSGVPYWDDLSLEFRSSLMLPHVDVHVYDDDPARRFILVDLQKYREGETLESGAVVEKINNGSIQLYYQGTRFLMEQ